jgi:GGDEF domain-containing protein
VDQAAHLVRQDGFGLIGASLGIAIYPADATCGPDLVRLADSRMYERKKSGRPMARTH